jgi:dTDP-L-rhamnose 4-epimerase
VSAGADRILVTGGAGFIGAHVVNRLIESGQRVRVLDCLAAQVHGGDSEFPGYLDPEAERVQGDVRDPGTVAQALRDVTAVYHFASAVGVGQSMYEIARYTAINNLGTAVLLEQLIAHPVERLIVASSMSVYGEGLYTNGRQTFEPPPRAREQLRQGQWELQHEGETLEPLPTPETKAIAPTSVYALSKFDQERLCLMFGETYGIRTVALRFFNVYGRFQSLSNPYTGVLAIFSARCLNGNPPMIFEDGRQRRDFVSVHDVARACLAALGTPAVGEVFNIASGEPRSILDIARSVLDLLGVAREPVITGKYRAGDIRHCCADISRARRLLGYQPQVRFEDGLAELAEWLAQTRADDRFLQATAELESRGLTV